MMLGPEPEVVILALLKLLKAYHISMFGFSRLNESMTSRMTSHVGIHIEGAAETALQNLARSCQAGIFLQLVGSTLLWWVVVAIRMCMV